MHLYETLCYIFIKYNDYINYDYKENIIKWSKELYELYLNYDKYLENNVKQKIYLSYIGDRKNFISFNSFINKISMDI